MRFRRVISVLVVCVCAFHAYAQIPIVPRDQLMSVTNPRHSSDSAFLKFDSKYVKAEPMNEDDAPRTFVYTFENVGSKEMTIKRLVSTCSCALASADRSTVSPGEKCSITVRYNPKGHPGRFERKIFVYTQDGNSPSAVLKLAVEVQYGTDLAGLYPVDMGKIRLRRPEMIFTKGKKAVESIRFVNVSGEDLRLGCEEMFLPECLSFRTEPAVVPDGREGMIHISYDPLKDDGVDRVRVVLKNTGLTPSRSTVKVMVKE